MMRTQRHSLRRGGAESGVALILALLIIVLLSVIVVEFMYESHVEASFAMNQASDLEAYLAAKSAVARGMALLAEDLLETEFNGEPEVDSVVDPILWAEGVAFEPLNGGTMKAGISDEYGKININALLDTRQSPPEPNELVREALRAFFTLRVLEGDAPPDTIVDAITDWLDYEDDDAEEPDGAENDYYEGLENPYSCKNGPMDSIEELLLVKGISPRVYFGDPEQDQLPLSEYLTVNGSWDGRVNINTALPDVIASVTAAAGGALDLDQALGIFDEVREQPRMTDEDANGQFQTPETQQTNNRQGNTRNQNQQEAPPPVRPFRVNSLAFRIRGDGAVGDVLVRVEAHVWRSPLNPQTFALPEDVVLPEEPFRVLSWQVIR